MGPPEQLPRRSESRDLMLSISRVLVRFSALAAMLMAMIWLYGNVIGPDASHNPSGAHVVGLVIILLVGIPIGAGLGSLVWCILGKELLGFTRDEVEPFLRPGPRIAIITRYTNWYMDLLFGPRSDVGAPRHGSSDTAGLNGSTANASCREDILYECGAASITAHWDEQTTKQFNLDTLKREWWQARRGTLRVMPGALAFDDWTLPYAEIDDAVVTLVQGIVPSYIIRIKSRGNSYQFSVTGSYFGSQLPFPARRTVVKGFTWSYLMARLLPLIALLALLLWSKGK